LTLFEKRFADFPAFGWTQRFSPPVENVIIKRELIDGEQGDDALAYVKKLKRAFERQRTVPDAEASPSANQI
jgi:hypothetical protein